MKKNKIYLSVIIILFIVILLLFLAIILIKSEDKKINSNNNSNSNTNSENKMLYECSKNVENNLDYSSIQKYIINIASDGELLNYTNQYIYTYSNKDVYKSLKTSDFDGAKVEFNDLNNQMIKSYVTDKIINSDNVEIHMWYRDFVKSLEKIGFTCIEK